MFIPLGLGSAIFRFPMMIFALFIAILGVSTAKFDDVKNYEHEVRSYLEGSEFQAARLDMIFTFCLPSADDEKRKEFTDIIDDYAKKKKITYEVIQKLASNEELQKGFECIADFKGGEETWPQAARTTAEYHLFKQFESEFQDMIAEKTEKYNLLTPRRIGFWRVMTANFSHFGYVHLIGNLFFLATFGLHLELALGSLLTLLVFVAGGLFGLLTEALFLKNNVILLGSSAGVAACIGAYLVIFWHAKMRFLFTYSFLYFRNIYLPVALTVPLFYIASDVIGLAEKFTGDSGSVAHLAHLAGFAFGACCAYFFKITSHIEWPFLFEDEQDVYKQFKNDSVDIDTKFVLAEKLFNMNRQNYVICYKLLEAMNKIKMILNEQQRNFVGKWLNICMRNFKIKRDKELILKFLKLTPAAIDRGDIFSTYRWHSIMTIADLCLDRGQFEEALRLYSLVLKKRPRKLDVKGVEQTCANIEKELLRKQQGHQYDSIYR